MVQGFTMHAGNVDIDLGYAVYPPGVVLIAAVKIADNKREIWRRYWSSRERAVDAADQLVYDCGEYLCGTLGCNLREVEDLDCDAFVHHLDMRLNNGFH